MKFHAYPSTFFSRELGVPPAENPFQPGAVVAMHSKIHNRFIRHRGALALTDFA